MTSYDQQDYWENKERCRVAKELREAARSRKNLLHPYGKLAIIVGGYKGFSWRSVYRKLAGLMDRPKVAPVYVDNDGTEYGSDVAPNVLCGHCRELIDDDYDAPRFCPYCGWEVER